MQIWLNSYMTYLEELGSKIGAYAKKAGLSQKELGRYCDISQTQISRIFNGVGDTTTEKLKSICMALEVSPEDLLFTGDEKVSFLHRPANKCDEENRQTHPVAEESHETIKMLSDLNYRLASEGNQLDSDELAAIEALLRTCLKSLHKELKNYTESQSVKTA